MAEPLDRAESVSIEYKLALEWSTSLDGLPVCYDDGAAFDDLFSTLTLRLKPSELTAWEAAWQGPRQIALDGWTGMPLGPEFPVIPAFSAFRMVDFKPDGPADSGMTLYDATAVLHYGPLSAPTAGSIAAVLSRGVPYHSVSPLSKAMHTDGGTMAVLALTLESDRMCKWYASGLSRAEIVDAINWLRTLRGGSYAWTATGLSRPFGPGEPQTATVRIPAWKISQESNFTWGIEMEVIRIG